MTAWGEFSPADFDVAKAAADARRAAKAGQDSLFATGTPERAAKPAPAPARLPGEVDLFAPDPCERCGTWCRDRDECDLALDGVSPEQYRCKPGDSRYGRK